LFIAMPAAAQETVSLQVPRGTAEGEAHFEPHDSGYAIPDVLPPAPPSAEPVAAVADLPGETVYNQACVACHGAGIAGAPKFGDKAAWAPRIAQGMDLLHTHSLQGYQGKAGYMPPKGGRTDLSDQSVINAVDYMVAASK
jgi:cytochrome c5